MVHLVGGVGLLTGPWAMTCMSTCHAGGLANDVVLHYLHPGPFWLKVLNCSKLLF